MLLFDSSFRMGNGLLLSLSCRELHFNKVVTASTFVLLLANLAKRTHAWAYLRPTLLLN